MDGVGESKMGEWGVSGARVGNGSSRHMFTLSGILLDGVVDPRVKDWPLMGNPMPTIYLSLLYFLSVRYVGPWVMRYKRPFEPTKLMLVYNAAQILFSLWLFVQAGRGGWFGHYNMLCEPYDYGLSTDPTTLMMASTSWWFFMSKFTEFADTLFLIMRKKWGQVSTLHVVHHGIMPFCTWAMVNTLPVGHESFTGFINPGVHFVMYIYYFIAALGPRYQKYIWWKKYLTAFQMVQFVMTFTHSCLILATDCDFPVQGAYLVIFLSVLFFGLFADYYIKSLRKPPRAVATNGSTNGSTAQKTK